MTDTSIIDHGAVDDVDVDSTASIAAAIQSCADTGGGRVVVPAGRFRCGTIELRSRVELHLAHGAEIVASPHDHDYAEMEPWSDTVLPVPPDHWHAALIVAIDAHDVAVTGSGTIRGRGFGRGRPGVPWTHRPRLISLVGCRDVLVSDVSLRDADRWNLHLTQCRSVRIKGISVLSHPDVLMNDDGLDLDGCRDVVVSDCLFSTGDDAICVKAGDYLRPSCASENISISNCVVTSATSAVKIGAVESTSPIRNVRVGGLSVLGGGGIHVDVFGGAHYENIVIEDVVFRASQDAAETGRAVRDDLPVFALRVIDSGDRGGRITGLALRKLRFVLPERGDLVVKAPAAQRFSQVSLQDVWISTAGTDSAAAVIEAQHIEQLAVQDLVVDRREAQPSIVLSLQECSDALLERIRVRPTGATLESYRCPGLQTRCLDGIVVTAGAEVVSSPRLTH